MSNTGGTVIIGYENDITGRQGTTTVKIKGGLKETIKVLNDTDNVHHYYNIHEEPAGKVKQPAGKVKQPRLDCGNTDSL